MMRARLPIALSCLVLASGCASNYAAPVASYDEGGYYEMAEPAPQAERDMVRGEMAPVPARSSMAISAGKMKRSFAKSRSGGGSKPQPAQQPQPTPRRKRLVHYDSWARLRVDSPEEAARAAVEQVRAVQGYVETQTKMRLVLRVPVAAFEALFDAMLRLGEVLDKSISAQDVTEAFTAIDLRLRTLKTARDRLTELLAKAKNENERLQILAQIGRLTEQIDTLEVKLDTLARLAAFSRITLELVPKNVAGPRPEEPVAAMRWIWQLSPYQFNVAQRSERLEVEVPEGFVELSQRDNFVAESADGAVIWSAERDNDPEGTTDFWLSAIETRLSRVYPHTKRVPLGRFSAIEVREADEDGLHYLIGVRVKEDALELIEVRYPTAAHKKRHNAAIIAALLGGEA